MKTVLITGATDGIGKVAAETLARAGWHVIVHGRNPEKTAAVARAIPGATAVVANFEDLAAVRAMADQIGTIHALINNAGVGEGPCFEVNHLAHYLLTRLLLPKLEAPRIVVTVASGAHRLADPAHIDRDYGGSKLANLLFTFELAKQAKQAGVRSLAFSPGPTKTRLLDDSLKTMSIFRKIAAPLFTKSPERIGQALASLVTDPPKGDFVNFRRRQASTTRTARDPILAARFWYESAERVGWHDASA